MNRKAVYVEKAASLFREGYNCAQSVFTAFRAETGFDLNTGLRLASPFGGGISHTGGLCGAVSGGIMVIGLLRGTFQPGDTAEKERLFAVTREFLNRFRAMGGALRCRELIGRGIETPDDLEQARQSGVFVRVCHPLVTGATAILESLLL